MENRIIVQRRPRCRLGADEKEEMKWTVRLTGIYILSCAICVSELCRVTVRRIRSGKSVIITRATLAEASSSHRLQPTPCLPLLALRPFRPLVSVCQPASASARSSLRVCSALPLLFHICPATPRPREGVGRPVSLFLLRGSVERLPQSRATRQRETQK